MKCNESEENKKRRLLLERRIERLEQMIVEDLEEEKQHKLENFEYHHRSLVNRYRNR